MTSIESIQLPQGVQGFRCTTENVSVPCTSSRLAPKPAPTVEPTPTAQDFARFAELIDSIHGAVEELEQRRRDSLVELQTVAIELAIVAATELTARVVESDQHEIGPLVARLIEELPLHGQATLVLHPDDAAQMKSVASTSAPLQAEHVVIETDSNVGRGNCRLTEESGRVVMSDLTRRMEEIRLAWLEELRHAQIERRQTQGKSEKLQRFPDRRGTA